MTEDEVIEAAQRKAFEQARAWLKRPYVRAVALGMRMRGGQYVEGERCVVVTIDCKHEPEAIAAEGRQAFPSTIETSADGRTMLVPVDVQVSEAAAGRLLGLPGRQIGVTGQHRGAVGFVASNAYGERFLVTAGHVVAPWLAQNINAFQVLGTNITARVDRWAWGRLHDQALLAPLEPLPHDAGNLPNGTIVSGFADLRRLSTGAACRVFRVAAPNPTPTFIRDFAANVRFTEEWTGKVVWRTGLIAVDACTTDGDSGSVLLTNTWQAIGTLVGELGNKNYFCPCKDLLDGWGVSP